MAILQLSKHYFPFKGGIELVAEMISRSFIDQGEKVYVVSFSDQDRISVGPNKESIINIKSDINFSSAQISLNFNFDFINLLKKRNITQIFVHLPNPYMHELVYRFSRLIKGMGIRLVAIYHSDIVNQKIIGPIYSQYFSMTMSIYDSVIVSSDNLWRNSEVLSKLPESKVTVIPFCINEGKVKRTKTNLSGNLLAIGRLVPYKGFQFLMDAIKDTPYVLTIIGDGPLRTELESIKTPNIKLMGQLTEEEKWEEMSKADALIISSINKSEAYGMTIVEAFSIGLPVIAPNINSGVSYLVQDSKTGLLYEPQNKNDLLQKLDLFYKKEDLSTSLSEMSNKFYSENLSYENFKKKVTFAA